MSTTPANTRPTPGARIRVLVVDDSAVVRRFLTRELERDPSIEVVGVASDPYEARDLILRLEPDVLTLDIEMPRMDGITFLRHLMQARPTPVVVVSSLSERGTRIATEALEAGAVDVLCKPNGACDPADKGFNLAERVRVAAKARPRLIPAWKSAAAPAQPTRMEAVFAIGASTGGVQAVTEVLRTFTRSSPPTLIVQHMPPRFTQSFAARLDVVCAADVREARHGDTLARGLVLIAPGGYHMVLRKSGGAYRVELSETERVHHQRPAVDVLFRSVAATAGADAVGALLTGMGADGAEGLLEMRRAGARTVAQDEATCIVYGMPAEAVKRNAAEFVLPLDAIGPRMHELCRAQKTNRPGAEAA